MCECQVNYCGAGEQDLLCINERQVMVRSKTMYDTEPPNTSLEGVQSDLQKRSDILLAACYFGHFPDSWDLRLC